MSPATCVYCSSPLTDVAVPCPACGMIARAPGKSLPPGTSLHSGRFAVGRVLGAGGFGITYKGAHRELRQPVAIKELFPAAMNAVRIGARVFVPSAHRDDFRRAQDRVLAEARVIAGFRSPHIVDVYAAFRANDTAYIVMEYLDGPTLETRLRARGPMSVREVRRLALNLCEALEEMHRRNLLHRDIKPARIVWLPNGRTVLIGFGSARLFDAGRIMRPTRILTEEYAAPEQYRPRARCGPYTDLFGLGATLYHALTGAPPPSAQERQRGRKGNDMDFPSVPDDCLRAAIRRALALRVEERAQTVKDFRAALRLTQPVLQADGQAASYPTFRRPPSPQYRIGAASTIGLNPARPRNEDSYGLTRHAWQYRAQTWQCLRACVADGMGGEAAGEIASQAAVDAFCQHPAPDRLERPDVQVQWTRALGWQANQAVRKAVGDAGGGCTLTGIVVVNDRLALAHVGDSRAYLHSPRKGLEPLSRDHSLVRALLDSGNMSEDEAATSPLVNQVTRALGQPMPADYVDTLASLVDAKGQPLREAHLTLGPGDRVLLMSDGVWGAWEYRESVIAAELTQIIDAAEPDPQALADALVQCALDAGGDDNATAVVIARVA